MIFDQFEINDLPFPVANAAARLRRAQSRDIPERVIDAAFEVTEQSVRLISIELLSLALRAHRAPPIPVVRLLGKRRSLGDRVQLMVHLVRTGSGPTHVQGLRSALGKRGDGLLARLEEIVRLRNQFIHEVRPEGARLAKALDSVASAVADLGAIEECIGGLQLVSVFAEPPEGADTARALAWMGPVPASSETTVALDSSLERRDLRAGSVIAIRDGTVCALGPFLIARDDPGRDDPELFVVETIGRGAEGLRATWNNLGDPARAEPPGGDDDVAVYSDLLSAWDGAANSDLSRTARLQNFYFTSTPALMSKLLDRYVERRDVPEALGGLFEAGRSGTLWLVAGPGAGKSSVVASVVRQYEAVHHFVSSSEGRNHPPAIFRSLVAQLIRSVDADELPNDQDALLPQQFSNLLARRAMSQTESEVVVVALDAIDELGDETAIAQFIQALPSELPDGVFLLVSSRPLPPGLRTPPGATRYVVAPLSIADIQRVAQMHGLPDSLRDCEKAFVASHGNPLLAVWALTLLRDNPNAELADTDQFDDVLSPLLARPMLGPLGPQVSRMLGVLVAARGQLDLPTLAMACGLDRLSTLQTVAALRDVLTVDRRNVFLSHHAVREYLLRPTSVYGLESQEVEAAHAALDDIAKSRPGSMAPRDRLWHAIKSSDPTRTIDAMGTPEIRREFARVLPELAATGMQVVPLLGGLAAVDSPWSADAVASGARSLALAGYWPLARDAVEASWVSVLSALDVAFVRLEIARASDNIDEIAQHADELLERIDGDGSYAEILPRLHLLKGESARVQGHHASAMASYERAVALADADSPDAFAAAFQLADLDYVHGRLTKAEGSLATLLTRARIDGDLVWETRILREIGHLDLSRGRRSSAAEWYRRSLDLALALGRKRLITQGYTSMAEALAAVEPERALELAQIGIEHGVVAGVAIELGKARTSMAEAHLSLGQLDEAVAQASQSHQELVEVGYGSGQARARLVRAFAHVRRGDRSAAESDARCALEYYQREQIHPHLWRLAATTLAEVSSGSSAEDLAAWIGDIPNLDELD